MELPDGECEILHMIKRMEMDGDIYDREVSYMSDHQIFSRMAKNGAWDAWGSNGLWESMEQVCKIAEKKKAMGWRLTWNPRWQPGLNEFTKQVSF